MSNTEVKQVRTTTYPIDPIFTDRWSPRSFQEKEVPNDALMSIFEAARWAPSANNTQPWRFIVAKTKEQRENFYTFINEGNLTWCKKAPVLAVLVSENIGRAHSFDAGAAWANLALQATNKGLITHPMGGFDKEKAREVLNIPENYTPHIVIAIGYQDEKEALPEPIQEREKPSDRLPLDEIVFDGTFK